MCNVSVGFDLLSSDVVTQENWKCVVVGGLTKTVYDIAFDR